MRKSYGEKEQERLDSDIKGVVERVFDFPEVVENYKYPFVVYEFKPREINIIDGKSVVEDILESLDYEYGDPDGDWTKPTEKMITAAEKLMKVVTSEYFVYSCETTGKEWRFYKEDILRILGESK